MTIAPPDLAGFRTGTVIPLTGLSGDNVGIAPDASHLSSGGYHVGCEDIQSISRWNTDYSTRQSRDRQQPSTNVASAMDIGDDWPHGGRAAWLRFNNLLVAQLRGRDPALVALRAVNFSPDGAARKRYDSFNPSQGVIDSTDSVYMHTHLEWWRDTVGTSGRAKSLARIRQIIDAAIRNVPLEDAMANAAELNASRNSWAIVTLQPSYSVYPGDVDGSKEVPATNQLAATLQRMEAKADAALKALGLAQADIDELQARPAIDPAALAAALAPLLSDHLGVEVTADGLTAALNSDAGQAALVKAANTAEDS